METGLTLEQHLQIRLLRQEAQEASRELLIEMLIDERVAALQARREFEVLMVGAGLDVEPEMDLAFVLPETEEEMVAVFGHRPSSEELSDYINDRIGAHLGAATMDVDIEAIALETDE